MTDDNYRRIFDANMTELERMSKGEIKAIRNILNAIDAKLTNLAPSDIKTQLYKSDTAENLEVIKQTLDANNIILGNTADALSLLKEDVANIITSNFEAMEIVLKDIKKDNAEAKMHFSRMIVNLTEKLVDSFQKLIEPRDDLKTVSEDTLTADITNNTDDNNSNENVVAVNELLDDVDDDVSIFEETIKIVEERDTVIEANDDLNSLEPDEEDDATETQIEDSLVVNEDETDKGSLHSDSEEIISDESEENLEELPEDVETTTEDLIEGFEIAEDYVEFSTSYDKIVAAIADIHSELLRIDVRANKVVTYEDALTDVINVFDFKPFITDTFVQYNKVFNEISEYIRDDETGKLTDTFDHLSDKIANLRNTVKSLVQKYNEVLRLCTNSFSQLMTNVKHVDKNGKFDVMIAAEVLGNICGKVQEIIDIHNSYDVVISEKYDFRNTIIGILHGANDYFKKILNGVRGVSDEAMEESSIAISLDYFKAAHNFFIVGPILVKDASKYIEVSCEPDPIKLSYVITRSPIEIDEDEDEYIKMIENFKNIDFINTIIPDELKVLIDEEREWLLTAGFQTFIKTLHDSDISNFRHALGDNRNIHNYTTDEYYDAINAHNALWKDFNAISHKYDIIPLLLGDNVNLPDISDMFNEYLASKMYLEGLDAKLTNYPDELLFQSEPATDNSNDIQTFAETVANDAHEVAMQNNEEEWSPGFPKALFNEDGSLRNVWE